jgi:hypothetical protein
VNRSSAAKFEAEQIQTKPKLQPKSSLKERTAKPADGGKRNAKELHQKPDGSAKPKDAAQRMASKHSGKPGHQLHKPPKFDQPGKHPRHGDKRTHATGGSKPPNKFAATNKNPGAIKRNSKTPK